MGPVRSIHQKPGNRVRWPFLVMFLALAPTCTLAWATEPSAASGLPDVRPAGLDKAPATPRVQHVFSPRTWSVTGDLEPGPAGGAGQDRSSVSAQDEMGTLKSWIGLESAKPEPDSLAAAVTREDEVRRKSEQAPVASYPGRPRHTNPAASTSMTDAKPGRPGVVEKQGQTTIEGTEHTGLPPRRSVIRW